MVIRMDLLPVQLNHPAQTTTVTLTRTSQQLLIPMTILHLRLPQIIHTHTLIRLRLLIYPIRILPIRQPFVLTMTIHMLQPR